MSAAVPREAVVHFVTLVLSREAVVHCVTLVMSREAVVHCVTLVFFTEVMHVEIIYLKTRGKLHQLFCVYCCVRVISFAN